MKLFGKTFDENDLFVFFLTASVIAAGQKNGEPEIEKVLMATTKAVMAANSMTEEHRQRILDLADAMAELPWPEGIPNSTATAPV